MIRKIFLVFVGLSSLILFSCPTVGGTVGALTITPAAGTYAGVQTVSITCETAEAVIFYTVDGIDPSAASTPYLEPFRITGPCTVKARAYLPGNTPSEVASADYVVHAGMISAGYIHNLALRADGSVWAWGFNGIGVFGLGTKDSYSIPIPIASLQGASVVSAGFGQSLVASTTGLLSMGDNSEGQLGDGTQIDRDTPTVVSGLTGRVVALAGGYEYSLALQSDGTVMAWGANASGQLGNGTTTRSLVPVAVQGVAGATAIACGMQHSLALLANGTVFGWGYNGSGQLGDNSTANRPTPFQIPGLANVTAIAAGSLSSYALLSDGTVMAWGYNYSGQLGNNTITQSLVPIAVPGLSNVTAIAAGGNFVLALLSDKTVCAWGSNFYGQLGIGSTANSLVPVAVPDIDDAVMVAAGSSHSIVVLSDGSLVSCGWNIIGQVGNSSTDDCHSFVPVYGFRLW